MKTEGYAALLGQLADALKRWVDELSIEFHEQKKFDRWFSMCVDDARLKLLAKLGAERRCYLANLIDSYLDQVKEQGKKFTGATGKSFVIRAEEGVPLVQLTSLDESYQKDTSGALEDMREQMHKCDRLFGTIDEAIRQTDLLRSDESEVYENRFAYFSSEICNELDIHSATLNKYAKAAGVATPGRGKKNHTYSLADYTKILRVMIKKAPTAEREIARDRFARIVNRLKDAEKIEGENQGTYVSRIVKSESKSKVRK